MKRQNPSQARVTYHSMQLRKLFDRADDKCFLELTWSVEMLRLERPDSAAKLLNFPSAATEQSISSPYRVHQWELETLLVQLLLYLGEKSPSGTAPPFDCSDFSSAAELINRLRKLENTESALYLQTSEFNIFGELHRIAQRQFHWQQGYFNTPNFYRYIYIYGQGKCADYFKRKYGISISDFNLIGFLLFTEFLNRPWIRKNFEFPDLGITDAHTNKVLDLILISITQGREETNKIVTQMNIKHGHPLPTAFLPSILRRYPLVCLTDESIDFIAPIPEELLIRVTSGLYYDLISGGQPLLNEANDRFEEYCVAYINAQMERLTATRAYRYEIKKGSPVDTPDILIRDANRIAIVAECKATKLTYLAQFSEDPFESEKKQYLQIANGAFQLWRFFSHVRRGLLNEQVAPDAKAIVITLDSFFNLNNQLRDKIIEEANLLADREGDIVDEDRRYIVFCPINSLEYILTICTDDSFIDILSVSQTEKYSGWELREICRAENDGTELAQRKKFPFDLAEILPWWKRLRELIEQLQTKQAAS